MLLSAAVLSGEYYNITVFPKKQEVFFNFFKFFNPTVFLQIKPNSGKVIHYI